MATLFSILALLPLLTGFARDASLRQSAVSMIPKNKEDLCPANPRLIILLHTVFNHNNKWTGKEIMHFGEKSNRLLAKEKYSGRQKKSAEQHALNKHLILDYLWSQKIEVLFIANDARSCYHYDFLFHYGLIWDYERNSKVAFLFLLKCLLFKLYFICKVYGDSGLTYYGVLSWI